LSLRELFSPLVLPRMDARHILEALITFVEMIAKRSPAYGT